MAHEKSRTRPISVLLIIVGVVLGGAGLVMVTASSGASSAGTGGALSGLASAFGGLLLAGGGVFALIGFVTVRRSAYPNYQRPPVTRDELPRAEVRKQ